MMSFGLWTIKDADVDVGSILLVAEDEKSNLLCEVVSAGFPRHGIPERLLPQSPLFTCGK